MEVRMDKRKIEIRSYKLEDLEVFTSMFTTYFVNDFKIEISHEGAKKMCEKISREVLTGILGLDLLIIEGHPIGFINSQVDSDKSDWCEREGWGFIREVYVRKDHRGQDLGMRLVHHVEENFYKQGINNVYLTSDDSKEFWIACGYEDSGKVSTINKDPLFEKISSFC